MSLKAIFEKDFVTYYGITTKSVSAACLSVVLPKFDLSDNQDSLGSVVPFGAGDVSFDGNDGEVQVLWYNHFINQCTKPRCFQEGRLRCDAIMVASLSKGFEMVLAEITTENDMSNLEKPILDGRVFLGGKNEKCRKQLYESLTTVLSVASLKSLADNCFRRVCLMAYHIREVQTSISGIRIRFPFRRFMKVESEVSSSGVVYSCPEIESFGFEYVRISHSQSFLF